VLACRRAGEDQIDTCEVGSATSCYVLSIYCMFVFPSKYRYLPPHIYHHFASISHVLFHCVTALRLYHYHYYHYYIFKIVPSPLPSFLTSHLSPLTSHLPPPRSKSKSNTNTNTRASPRHAYSSAHLPFPMSQLSIPSYPPFPKESSDDLPHMSPPKHLTSLKGGLACCPLDDTCSRAGHAGSGRCRGACLRACVPACLRACLRACLLTCLPICLPAYLPICLPAYLPICLSWK